MTHARTTTTLNNTAQPTSDSKTSYVWFDGAEQSQTLTKPNINLSTVNSSSFAYDTRGRIQSVAIQDGRPRNIAFVTDLNGQVVTRDEADNQTTGDPHERHYYFNGLQVGDVSNDGTSNIDYAASIAEHRKIVGTGAFRDGAKTGTPSADFDQSYDAINGLNLQSASTSYTVVDGDTLQSIAQQLWGDASFWYLIADANGLSASDTLVGGQTLIIPDKVHNAHNDATTFRVYDPNQAIGNVSPTAIKPQAPTITRELVPL